MNIATPILIVIALISLVWIFIEFKRFKHKMIAVFLIGLILTIYLSFTFAIREQGVDLKSIPGIKSAVTLYFNWITSVVGNFKTITSNAINLKWKPKNETEPPEIE